MKQMQKGGFQRLPYTWFTTRTLVIAFAVVEALAIGAALLYGS